MESFIIYFLSFVISNVVSESGSVNVMCLKSLSSIHIVESKEIHLIYSIFNVGSSDITNVVLKDDPLPSSDFKTLKETTFMWNRIPAMSNVTVSVPVLPIKGDILVKIPSATVTYKILGEKDAMVALSNQIGSIGVMPFNEYL
ncbi:hypothetical protein MXB_3506, partial [Myxobolus squamalis]